MVDSLSRRDFLRSSAWAAGLFAVPAWVSALDEEMPPGYMPSVQSGFPLQWTPPQDLSNTDLAVLTLNRVTFGPRPGDVERVRTIGVDNFIEEQLSPASLDDSAADVMLGQFRSLALSAEELSRDYGEAARQRQLAKANPSGDGVTDVAASVKGFLGLFGVSPQGMTGPSSMPVQPTMGPEQIVTELVQATMLRQIFSQRQLFEVMVDFWSNHLNIYVLKNQDRYLKTVDDREVVRGHAMGKFSDLLHASAHSPAMLVYLDNITNVKGVPNENYARELMELHTLSVNGGYTQADVQSVARCFTGWSVNGPIRSLLGDDYGQAGTFVFRPKLHDDGPKELLGVKILAGGGIKDGEQVLDILAGHPKTAEFISRKLVQRFVSDDPPESLVAQAAASFAQSDGDILAVLSTILHSAEFKQSFGQKVKRPLEYVASSVRALAGQLNGASTSNSGSGHMSMGKQPGMPAQAIAQAIRTMGQVPFMWPSPNGYPDRAGAWINSNGLLARWNLALALSSSRAAGLTVDLRGAADKASLSSGEAIVDHWLERLLHRDIPEVDRAKLVEYLGGDLSDRKASYLVALILASPHFQLK